MSVKNGYGTNPASRWTRALRLAALVAILSFIPTFRVTSARTQGAEMVSTHVRHADNGVWLGHAYVTTPSYVEKVPTLADDMQQHYSVVYWFVNVGKVDSTGRVIGGAGGLSQAVAFLNTLHSWETSHHYQFKVYAWINGILTPTAADALDVGNAATRQTIARECQRFVAPAVAGSYIAGAARAFDGVQIDFEPSGLDTTRFAHLTTLMEDIRQAFTAYPGKLTSFTPPKYGTRNEWEWSPAFYYDMGHHVDLLAAMTYDADITTGPAYQDWMREQTMRILQAVSGRFWHQDAQHPAPRHGVKVMLGFPAFPANAHHDVNAENIKFAAPGVEAGLQLLRQTGDPSYQYFQGAGVFLHTDGTGGDHYANRATDWWWFGHDWLRAW
jgi:hypothetical protein